METIKKEGKPGSGKQKIEIKKIEGKTSLQVAFSKRKRTLLDKASELSVLCGAEIALIAFSPAGKAFACGHPTPDHILERFLNNTEATGLSKIHKGDELSLCQQRSMEVQKELEVEQKRGLMLEALVNCGLGSNDDQFEWDAYVDGLSLTGLEKMKSDMEVLKKFVEKRCDEMMSNVASFSSWSMTVPDSNVNKVDADDSFDFVLDGQLSNVASFSSPMSDESVAADDSSDFFLDVNPIADDDPLHFLNIDYPCLLEYECC